MEHARHHDQVERTVFAHDRIGDIGDDELRGRSGVHAAGSLDVRLVVVDAEVLAPIDEEWGVVTETATKIDSQSEN